MNTGIRFSILLTFIVWSNVQSTDPESVAKIRIESCSSCKLNQLPEVKKFIFEDVKNYENVDFHSIHGASPEMVLLNSQDEVIERIPLDSFSREQCNKKLVELGFKLKKNSEL